MPRLGHRGRQPEENMTRQLAIALLIVALPIAACADEAKTPSPTPLDMSVMIFHEWGLQDASTMVELAAKHGHRRVNFVITIHCQLDEDLNVLNYGLIRARKGWQYEKFDDKLLALFQQHLKTAFTRAVELELDIAILPHVDAAGPKFGWHNEFDLDPLKSCGGISYQQVMIDSIANALEESVNDTTQVEFALTGEMGRTVFAYPDAYRKLMADLRKRKRLKRLTAGVSINFNKVTGNHQPTTSQIESVQRLFAESDFLGMSCYGSVSVPPQPKDFATTLEAFVADVKRHGVAIPLDLDLHFSEVGLGGGGSSQQPEDIEHTPATAASSPWAGTSDAGKNPWASTAMRDFRREYHQALLTFLQSQRSDRKVTAAFLWNTGSWCPYGSDNKTFTDAEIMAMIRRHNAESLSRQSQPKTIESPTANRANQ